MKGKPVPPLGLSAADNRQQRATLCLRDVAPGAVIDGRAIDEAERADLNRGRLYLQLFSEKAPEGNLWGWLLPQEKPRDNAKEIR